MNEGEKLAGNLDLPDVADDNLKRVVRESNPVKETAAKIDHIENTLSKNNTVNLLKDVVPPKETVDKINQDADAVAGETGDKLVDTQAVPPVKASKTRKNIPGKSDTNIDNKEGDILEETPIENKKGDIAPVEIKEAENQAAEHIST